MEFWVWEAETRIVRFALLFCVLNHQAMVGWFLLLLVCVCLFVCVCVCFCLLYTSDAADE